MMENNIEQQNINNDNIINAYPNGNSDETAIGFIHFDIILTSMPSNINFIKIY